MGGLTSLKVLYHSTSYFYLSFAPLFRRETGDLPLSHLRELSVLGPYENDIMASVHKLVAERKGDISILTVPLALEYENLPMWESLKSLVPDFRVRHLFFRKDLTKTCFDIQTQVWIYMDRSSKPVF